MSNKDKSKKGKKVKHRKDGNMQLEIHQSIRKPHPRATKVINPRKKYDRRDDSWKNWKDDE